MDNLTLLQKIIVFALPLLFAITLHEVAHGWVASKRGDLTAKMLGRLTINPLKHIDPVGTILVPGLLLYFGGFIFGWAKPVPVVWRNLKHPKSDMLLVAIAGPMANLLMAIFWAFILKLGINKPVALMGSAGISINLMLMVLNLLPIPPLDGSRVLSSLLPNRASYWFDRMEPLGLLLLLVLLATGVLGYIISPFIYLLGNLIYSVFGLN